MMPAFSKLLFSFVPQKNFDGELRTKKQKELPLEVENHRLCFINKLY